MGWTVQEWSWLLNPETSWLEGRASDLEASLKEWERKESEERAMVYRKRMEDERKQHIKKEMWENWSWKKQYERSS